ncbi:hypothetical protein [Qipengyuania citrea]|uniref:hypothetical protein n=1 Tax=Qipengyuania citrea TaxID=225971 RepID=UPI00209DDC62|nr:hypothetical protein [Qipengyuania citrea]MCP2016840.1 hypothetical protein [Qipengyuania citrea]
MTYFFSPSTGGFYTRESHGNAVPADAVKVSVKRHAALMKAQMAGARIEPDAKGRPQVRRPAAADLRAALARGIAREARRRILAISPEWRQMNDIRQPSDAGAARFAAIDAIRSASDRIEAALTDIADADLDQFQISENPSWPEVQP